MTSRFEITPTALEGVAVLKKRPVADARGYLERVYCADDLEPALGARQIVQVNRTLTRLPGVVRGLHFQRPPHAELKVVSCLRGAVFDVAVDLRAGSATFLQWYGLVLSANEGNALVIPEGYAHGFQTLEPMSEMLYLHTSRYVADAEGGLNCRDPRIGVRWPQPISETSERDATLPFAGTDFEGLAL